MSKDAEALRRNVTADDRLDLGLSASATTSLGSLLAERARGHAPTAVLHWTGDADAILAHVVASVLDVPHYALAVDEGLMTISRPLPEGSRAVLIGAEFTANRPIDPVTELLGARGHSLVAALTLCEPAQGAHAGTVPIEQP